MRFNLLLLVVIAVGAWYFYNQPVQPPPEAAPVDIAPTARANYSGVRTFYSTLNDPAVPVGTNYSSYTGSASGSTVRSATLGLGATSAVNSGARQQQSSISLGGSRSANYGASNGEPTLNIKQRASNIKDAAKGE